MDYRRNEDYIYRGNGYAATLNNGLYNGCHNVNIDWGAAITEPVTLNDFKLWGKIDTTEDNALISALITTSRMMCEQYCNTGFVSREIVADINNANGGFILPYGPVTSTPTAVDEDGNALTLVYNFNQLQSPCCRMTVSYTGGYSTLPEQYKTAIMEQCLFLYENRGDIAMSEKLSPLVRTILNPLTRQT